MSTIEEVYEKYKHLDDSLSDPGWCTSGEGAAIYAIAGELWRAVKEARNKPRPQCEECHINSIIEQKRGCLTCRDPECPVWQAADQNCWESQEEHDDSIISQATKAENKRVLYELMVIATGYESYKHISGGTITPNNPVVGVSTLKRDIASLRLPRPKPTEREPE